jgi:predicted  nucleic acid-binding Zn-ribbon protein
MLLCLFSVIGMQAQDIMRSMNIHSNDNTYSLFPCKVINSVEFSKFDWDGMPHQNYVLQLVNTPDSTYSFSMQNIDSVTYIKYLFKPAEMIDMGLSVKWASYNLGASKPEEIGGLYGWADPTGLLISDNPDDYPSADPPLLISNTEYDIATAKWGPEWKLPTKEEVDELINNCTFEWTTQNGVIGAKFTAKNGNSLFFPAAGLRAGVKVKSTDKAGCYWSGTRSDDDTYIVYALCFGASKPMCIVFFKEYGFAVRPVSVEIRNEAITGDSTNITDSEATLNGSVRGMGNAKVSSDAGVCYSTTAEPSMTNGTYVSSGILADGDFSVNLVGLSDTTKYYYRTCLNVDGKYYYGETKTFITLKKKEMAKGELIDLGLSVKWANFNVGASKPEEAGGLYGWADPTGKLTSTNPNDYPSSTPPASISGTDYDIAKALWGSDYRMPTQAEIQELLDKCTGVWTTVNGVKGMKFTATNGNSIFMPASGDRYGTELRDNGLYGAYWSGTLKGTQAYMLYFEDGASMVDASARMYGYNVRPVSAVAVVNPVATTGASSAITTNSATVAGNVTGMATAKTSAEAGICYGTVATPTKDNATYAASTITSDGDFTVNLTALQPNTTYYYRATLTIDGKIYYGEVKSFTTTAQTQTGAEIVDLGLSVKWASYNLGATAPSGYGGYYKWADPTGVNTSNNYDDYPSANPPATICGTQYDIAKAQWGGNWRLPSKDEFVELVTKCTIENVSKNGVPGAELTGPNGNKIFLPASGYYSGDNFYGKDSYTDYWTGDFSGKNYGKSNAYAMYISASSAYGNYTTQHTIDRFPVRPVYAEPVTAKAITGESTNVSYTSATVAGSVTGMATATSKAEAGVCVSKTSTPSMTNGTYTKSDIKADGNFTIDLSGLEGNTTYYYCTCLNIDGTYYYGEVKSFTTLVLTATATTGESTNVLANSATLAGSVTGMSLAKTTADAGICYATTNTPSMTNGTYISSGIKADGSFTVNVSSLTDNTTYYYCTCLNIDGTYYYGAVKSFTTAKKATTGEMVDLGLSVKWANYNIGATAPEEGGSIVGWGDVTGEKTSANPDDFPNSNPPTEISDTEYDIAKAKWGGTWRLPTSKEAQELWDNTTKTLETINGINCIRLTSKTNSNSIVIPFAGYYSNSSWSTGMMGVGTCFYLWTGTKAADSDWSKNNAYALYGASSTYNSDGYIGYVSTMYRYYRMSVRPVSK